MREDDQMTKQQAEEEVIYLKKVFQEVRLFPVDVLMKDEDSCKTEEKDNSCCMEICHTNRACENCVCRKAINTKREKGKIEILNGKLYQTIARYVEIDKEAYVLVMIRCLDDDWMIGDINHERLISIFENYNDTLYRDAVTNAYNRRYYEDEIKQKRGEYGVALIDLDDFKIYNNTYGHHAGDMALYTVADIIQKNIRRSEDKLIRLGGDEFVLIIQDIEESDFPKKLRVIQEKIRCANVPGYTKMQLSVSMGGVLARGETIENAVSRADHLMYQAKIKKNMVLTEQDENLWEAKNNIRKQQILVVDDSEMNRELLKEMLKDDFEILEAQNGAEGIEILQNEGRKISLVLLDIVMPVMDGFEVLTEMNKNRWIEDIPVIMISSEGSETFIRKAFKFGVSDYISRPFDSKVVYRRVFNNIKLYAKQRRLLALVSDQMREKEKNNQMMVEILSQIVEFRNGESGLHVLHINMITRLLLERLVQKTDQYNLAPDDCDMIATASAFHDIGKIAIDEKILNKKGKLTAEEYELMKKHTVIGASMLDKMEQYKKEKMIQVAYQICRWHHERYDGHGYPDGLVGEEIPIAAQVVSIADVYDALISERCYKKAYTHEEAINLIKNGECGMFHPLLLESLLEVKDKLRDALRV